MSIAYRTIKDQNGNVDLESEVDKGTKGSATIGSIIDEMLGIMFEQWPMRIFNEEEKRNGTV